MKRMTKLQLKKKELNSFLVACLYPFSTFLCLGGLYVNGILLLWLRKKKKAILPQFDLPPSPLQGYLYLLLS